MPPSAAVAVVAWAEETVSNPTTRNSRIKGSGVNAKHRILVMRVHVLLNVESLNVN